jgi:outer membrane protein assembly factor BamB
MKSPSHFHASNRNPAPVSNSLVSFSVAQALITLCFLVGFSECSAEDFAQFRGPNSSGISTATGLAEKWDATTNIKWKTPLPGSGASSPITFNGKIYASYYDGYGLERGGGDQDSLTRHLVCVDPANGKIEWDSKIPSQAATGKFRGFIELHGFASSTPVADASGVYVYCGTSGLAGFGHDGKIKWQSTCGTKTHGFGTGASPTIYKDLVIVNASVESGSLIAFNKISGQEVWRVKGITKAWNSPVLVPVGGAIELVINTPGKLLGIDPATGGPLWECSAISDYICPSVVAHEGVVYGIGGRKNTTVAVKAGGRGDVTETHKLWTLDRGSNVSSAVFHDGHLYWSSEGRGIVYCANASTGEIVYEERVDPRPGRIYASPLYADGRIYFVSRNKGTFVVAASPSFKLLSHNVIESDTTVFNASPIVHNGRLLLRSNKALYSIGK